MSESRSETAVRVMRELRDMCEAGTLQTYIDDWLDTPESQRAAADLFDQAYEGLRILHALGEYIHQHYA